MAFGNANYEKGFKKKNYFKLADGSQIFRILPPVGDLAAKGVWSRYYSVHFGYKNMAGKLRTFLSTEQKNQKTKMIEVPDPALDRINDLKAKLEGARAAGNQPLVAKLNALVGQKGIYNVDRNHHMNVIELTTGKVGVLKLRHKAKLALDEEIKRLKKEDNCDPLSVDNGRFFTFTRTGTSNETNFKVVEYKEKREVSPGVKADFPFVHKASADMEADCADLDNLFQEITVEECQAIVDESDLLTGKSPACDRFFDDRWKAEREQSNQAGPDENDEPGADYQEPTSQPASAPTAQAPAVAPQQAATPYSPTPAAPAASATQAAYTAAVAQGTAPQTAAPAAQAPAALAAAAPTQAQAIEEMTDADFFASIGVKTA